MFVQKSFHEDSGILYLVPTPIGNLEDMTFRGIRILKEADYIAAEDTRQTKKLCNYFEISTPLVSYHEHNKESSGEKLLEHLKNGKTIAVVTDAGTPAVSDPGYELVVSALQEQITVVPLPGANAAVSALIASGLETKDFYFYGFLPRGKKERKVQLQKLKGYGFTMMLYESPHRLKETLAAMLEILGNRKIAIARELTKKYEEFVRGTLQEAVDWAQATELKGEFCLIVEGCSDEERNALQEQSTWWEHLSLIEHVNHYIEEEQVNSKEAIKKTASDRDLSKREVYQAFHVEQ
ncbi:hypothetical protein A374_16798 [Fictibacillus macauensis ZFHKF-1]|uniref:Ribosomal RNA small subunit methyltransferase I n=1 Tax=Fictibacillus macauensis ZFHKF-1 TaxID=1196324 RepID=I8IXI4_9BACL|nr:16S rRNA (cytidine(1402)-2'-O)-methyltransferase [Fictibacillus macauensis]EIT84201.1 hypothetical protein A374_16798 [Fictibacillus macauensis ZFHKF-1]